MIHLRSTGAIILMIAYGYAVKEHDDPFVEVVEDAVKGFSETLEPGAYLVDVIPARQSSFFRFLNAADANYALLSFANSPICP
jgi:hypothetical protein